MIELGSEAQQEIRRIVAEMDAIEKGKKDVSERQAAIRARLDELERRIAETGAKKRPVYDGADADDRTKVERLIAGEDLVTDGKSASDRERRNAALDHEIAQLRENAALLERAEAECRDELGALETRRVELTIEVARQAFWDIYERTIAEMETLALKRLIPLRQLNGTIRRLGGAEYKGLSLLTDRVKLGYWSENRPVDVWPRYDDEARHFQVMPFLAELVAKARQASASDPASEPAETEGAAA